MRAKKIVIIGGGISGLTVGIYARLAGFEVEIYEKHTIPGGECTGWDRNGFHIDNCIHWLMGSTGTSTLNGIWKTIGAIESDADVIRNDRMYTSELNGQTLTLWQNVDKTEAEMIALSPEDEVEIRHLMKFVRLGQHACIPAEKPAELMNLLDVFKLLCRTKETMQIFKEFRGMDTQDLMNRFHHPLIRCLISDFCPKESLAYSFPMAYGNYISGDGGIPRGGSRAMAMRVLKKLESLGGHFFAGQAAVKLRLDGSNAVALCLENGKEVLGDYFVATCDPCVTFGTLLDKTYTPKLINEFYQKPKDYPVYSMIQAAFAVNCPDDALGGDIMISGGREIVGEPWAGDRLSVKTYSYEPSFAPNGCQIIQVLAGGTEDAYFYWKKLKENQAAYKAKKEELGRKFMARLEERIPAYKDKMTLLDVWTPVTYERYCNAYKGYNQACMITKRSAAQPYPSAYLNGLSNVLLAGQWLSPPGGLPGAAINGKYAVQRILKKEKRKLSF